MRIAVTGIGVVSALGVGVGCTYAALLGGRSGISAVPRLLATHNRIPVGEVASSNSELTAMLGLDPKAHLSRTALLGMLAAREALSDAAPEAHLRVALVSATSVGGMDLTEGFFADYMRDPDSGRLRNVVMHDCQASTRAIAGHCGITGYTTTISTACSSAANALMLGARLIECGVADCVVAGGCDALSAFTLNGFKSLMILDGEPCRPFDSTRAGLNLGEGAGYVVLQREDTLKDTPYCYLDGFANTNDAFHQTASSAEGEGAYRAMHEALERGCILPSQVDYINVHGTGTINNDSSESAAIKRLFGNHIPPFSSTKSFTGHTLAASGGIEAVFSALSIRHGVIFPNLNFRTTDEALGIAPVTEPIENTSVGCVLSNSFGFGGNCTSLVFKKD